LRITANNSLHDPNGPDDAPLHKQELHLDRESESNYYDAVSGYSSPDSLDAAQWLDWDSEEEEEEEDETPYGRPSLGGAGDFNAGLNGVGTASTESHLTLNSGNQPETARTREEEEVRRVEVEWAGESGNYQNNWRHYVSSVACCCDRPLGVIFCNDCCYPAAQAWGLYPAARACGRYLAAQKRMAYSPRTFLQQTCCPS